MTKGTVDYTLIYQCSKMIYLLLHVAYINTYVLIASISKSILCHTVSHVHEQFLTIIHLSALKLTKLLGYCNAPVNSFPWGGGIGFDIIYIYTISLMYLSNLVGLPNAPTLGQTLGRCITIF